MRKIAKIDANHKEIVSEFRRHGCTVLSLAALGRGVPDLLVAAPEGATILVEIKSAKGKLTPQQQEFRKFWPGPFSVIRDVAGAETLCKILKKGGKSETKNYDRNS